MLSAIADGGNASSTDASFFIEIYLARFRQGQNCRKAATQSHRSKELVCRLHDSGTAGSMPTFRAASVPLAT